MSVSSVKSVRLRHEKWLRLEARAKEMGTTINALIDAAIEPLIAPPAEKRR